MNRLTLILCAALALCGLYAWNVTDSLSDTKKQLNEAVSANQQLRDKVDKVTELDRKNTEALKNAREENDRLNAAVTTGNKRVYVKASCPKPTAASVGNAGTAELDRESRQDYFRLRQQLIDVRQQVLVLQDYVRDVCLK
ncbi:MAG: lysis protein [Hafnia sp.]